MEREKVTNSRAVRFPEKLHRAIKLQAFKEGKTIQEWVFAVLEKKLEDLQKKTPWLCETCGGWKLTGTQMAIVGQCEYCDKQEIAVFPCVEKT